MFFSGPKLEVFIVMALKIVLNAVSLSEPCSFCDFHTSYFQM